MRRLLILLFVLLPVPVLAAGSIYTSAKTNIAALKGCVTTAPCELPDLQYVRAMLVSGYTYNAAHDFVNDVQSFEVTDDSATAAASRHGYYRGGFDDLWRLKLTSRVVTGSVLDADDLWWPQLTNVTVDGLILFYYDRNCDFTAGVAPTASACRTGATHPLLAYFPISPAKTLVNQGLLIQWSNVTTERILNYSNASSAAWTATDPTVLAISSDPVTLADCSPCLPSASSPQIVSGTATMWKRYVPTTVGGIVWSDGNIPNNLAYVIFDGIKIDGRQISTFPTDLGNLTTNGCDFCLFANMIVAGDLRTDRGMAMPGRRCWSGTDFNTDCPKQAFEADPSSGTGSDFPGTASTSTTASSHVAFLNTTFRGYRNAGTQAANNVYFLDSMVTHIFDASVGWNSEQAILFRTVWAVGPNHGTEFKALPVREMTWSAQDSVFGQSQDWITGDSNLGVNGGEELIVNHCVFYTSLNRPSEADETNSTRLNRVRKWVVFLDNFMTWGSTDTTNNRMIGKILRPLAQAGGVLVDYNVFKYEQNIGTQPISIYNPVAQNNEPTNAATATWITLDATNRVRVRFRAERDRPAGSDFQVMWLTDRASGTPVLGNIEARIETDAGGSPSGSAIYSVTTLAADIKTATTNYIFQGVLTTPMVEGDFYEALLIQDAAYRADYTASAGVRNVKVATTLTDATITAYVWNGSAWVSSASKIGYVIGTDEEMNTVGAWSYGSHNILTTATHAAIVASMPAFTVPFPSSGTLANTWGLTHANTLGTVRSWFQPAMGSVLINAGSDGTNIGLSGGASEPTDPDDPPPDPTNTAPNNVNAGADQTIESGAVATITCSGTDDGLPNPPNAMTYAWAKVSGSGTATFNSASSASTTVTFSTDNETYVLSCTVSDSVLSTADNVSIAINDGPSSGNVAPTVDAGADISISLGGSLVLTPSISDDGLGLGDVATAYSVRWSVPSGPSIERMWVAPSDIPYIRNDQGSDLSMSAAWRIKQAAGLTEPIVFDLRSTVDPVNTHTIAFKAVGGLGTFTYVGQASTPGYTSQGVAATATAGPTVAVTPPSMTSGDLVVLFGAYRNSSVTLAMSATGGQTWTCGTNLQNAGDALTTKYCYAIYNGTWGANPSMTVTSGTDAMSVRMMVWSPSPGSTVSEDVAEATTTGQGSDPLTVAAVDTTTNGALVLALVADQDDNRWSIAGSGQAVFSGSGPDSVNTSLDFPATGTYTVCVNANDGQFDTQDCRVVTVTPSQTLTKFRPFRGRGGLGR